MNVVLFFQIQIIRQPVPIFLEVMIPEMQTYHINFI